MAKIILNGEVGVDITLYKTVQAVQDLRRQGELTSLEVDVTSVGGSSVEGRDLYNYFKTLGIPVSMNAVGYVCSAAFTFFLAGQKRTAQNKDVEFLMHSPKFAPDFFDMIYGLSDDELEQLKKGIAEEKQTLAKIYSQELGIEIETIKSLMDKDEIITAESAKSLGMIQSIISETVETPINFNYKIAAKYYTNDQEKEILTKLKSKMEQEQIEKLTKSIDENTSTSKSLLEKFVNFLNPKKVVALNINAEDGTMIEIVGDVLEVGAQTVEPAEGTFEVIYEEKRWTVVIAANAVTELTEVVEETETEETMEAVQAERDALKQELEDLKAKNAENQAKLDDVVAKHEENEKLINKLRSIESKMFNEDGSVNFDGLGKVETTTEGSLIAKELREKRNKK